MDQQPRPPYRRRSQSTPAVSLYVNRFCPTFRPAHHTRNSFWSRVCSSQRVHRWHQHALPLDSSCETQ